jgi:hypothetical protein
MEAEIRWNCGAKMTDEQWEIVNALRMLALGHGGITCAKAANEIERLVEELKRSQTIARELAAELGYVFDRNRGGIRDR